MPAEKKANFNDIAKLTDVSRATVSRVINNHSCISPETVLKVREAAKKIGYAPRPVNARQGHRAKPRRPSSYRKMQVALISQHNPKLFGTPVYSKVLQGIEDELGKLDYSLIVRNLPDENPEEKIPRKIDGAIIFHVPTMYQNRKLMRELRRMPCVSVMGVAGENEFFDHVTYNNTSVGKIAAEYLLGKGHRNLLFISYTNIAHTWNSCRYQSFMSAIKNAGAKSFEIMSDGLIDESGNMQLPNVKAFGRTIEEMKQLPEIPTAVFASSDIFVIGLYHTLKHHGIIPGKDIEIVGVNNDSIFLNQFTPRPASVDIHAEMVGRKAVVRLLWRIDNPKEPLGNIEIEPEMAFE